jgi:hypothetical protein
VLSCTSVVFCPLAPCLIASVPCICSKSIITLREVTLTQSTSICDACVQL